MSAGKGGASIFLIKVGEVRKRRERRGGEGRKELSDGRVGIKERDFYVNSISVSFGVCV